jgi:ABC-type glycerol-3-phosphate transport system substrate-binding protein
MQGIITGECVFISAHNKSTFLMKNLNIFQTILLGVFALAAVGGAIAFGTFRGKGGTGGVRVNIAMWGSVPKAEILPTIKYLSDLYGKGGFEVFYEEHAQSELEGDVLEAIASGSGPDLVIIPDNYILTFENKIAMIPLEAYSERVFRDTFVEGGEIFLTSQGIIALPFVIDPMVQYWNRDLYTAEGIVAPPKYWLEFFALARKLSKLDKLRNILQSAVGLGAPDNIDHAKEILSTLILQTGNVIIRRSRNTIGLQSEFKGDGVSEALRFYTEFGNPVKPIYSWNRSLPLDKSSFLGGTLATYFGFASEYHDMRIKNPNLNFDISAMPQAKDTGYIATFGRIYGIAVLKTSRYKIDALNAAKILTERNSISNFINGSKLAPARRDLLVELPTDRYGSIAYSSAIISRAWLDPDPEKTDKIFNDMVSSAVAGKESSGGTIQRAHTEIEELLKK